MPSRSHDGERTRHKHDDVRAAAAATLPRGDKELARPMPVRTQPLAAVAPTPTRLDSRIEGLLRTKRAGLVRDYASITQLKHEHTSVATRKNAAHASGTASSSDKPCDAALSSKALVHAIAASSSSVVTASSSNIGAATTPARVTKLTHTTPKQQQQQQQQQQRVQSNQLLDDRDIQHWHSPSSKASPKQNARTSPSSRRSPGTIAAALGDSSVELSEIKQSVQRLRAQRTHVEQLRQHNERLELLVSEHAREREQLRAEIASLRGVEQENVGLLQSFKLLEERLQSLEDTAHEKREQLRAAHERTADVEAQRSRLEASMHELEHEHAQRVDALKAKQTALVDRIRQLERDRNALADKQQRVEQQWRDKVQLVRHEAQQGQHDARLELETSRQESKRLRSEVAALETQVQTLLATTVRQTSVIEDCDRVLSETKAQQKAAKASYHDQLELNGRLKDQLQQLETQLSALQAGSDSERVGAERWFRELESKLRKRKDRIEILQVALHERDKQIEALERESATRNRSAEHYEELNEDLRRRERALMSEISELQLALGDVTDERKILTEQLASLQGKRAHLW